MKPRIVDLERAARAVHELLDALGAPKDDPELSQTGRRVAEAYGRDLLSGYDKAPEHILSDSTQSTAPGLVVLSDVPTVSMCPHHLMPAVGVAHVAYLPNTRVVGFGALAELVDCFARRLTLQEDLGRNVAEALVTHLEARAAACVLHLEPTCITARGGRRHGANALTYAWAGTEATEKTFRDQVLMALRAGDDRNR